MVALAVFALAAVLGVGAYAFTASNTVPAQAAGGGQAVVSGYAEKGVSYTWNEEGTEITKVHFILTSTEKLKPSDVKVALTEAAPKAADWVDCPPGGYIAKGTEETEIACTFTAPGIANAVGKQLTVAAVSQGEVVIE
jgi:hypothetical protein